MRAAFPGHMRAMQNFAPTVIFIYAAALVLSGLLSWRLHGRRLSFTAGLASAALLAMAYRLSLSYPGAGYLLATVLALALAASYGLRFRKTKQLFPSGVLLLLSGAAMALLAIATMLSW
ncbi:MAG: hypothetical protein A3H27_12070 [Acidobacteria bacterium RIFCSPLOWO2_02_FULL_59_13]|nr:MAG: hypothetical protein A3H27_12070 [Acidobacteria bacterium RIFCSPLOWO2_02_FULL_59_13]